MAHERTTFIPTYPAAHYCCGFVAARLRQISGLADMTLVGLGLLHGLVPFNIGLFDRSLASTRFVGTATRSARNFGDW
jgi:hypothetical protein